MAGSQLDLFDGILTRLADAGVLDELVLVGSWCLPVYRIHYGNYPEIPALRTKDLDFLVRAPGHVRTAVNIAAILQDLGFEALHDFNTGLAKYGHENLEVEFLAPRSRHSERVLKVPKLNIEAQVLSYLEIAEKYAIPMSYRGLSVRVPEIAAFVLHKAIVQTLRSTEEKREKDALTVRSLGELVAMEPDMRMRAEVIFRSFPSTWKRIILGMVNVHSPELQGVLRNL